MRHSVLLSLAVGVLAMTMTMTLPALGQDATVTKSALTVLYQAQLTQEGYVAPEADGFWWTPTDRGYYAAYAGLIPQDPTKGARLVGWDVSVDHSVVLLEDLNAVCGSSAQKGVPGHRIGAMLLQDERHRGYAILLGTAANTGPGVDANQYPGGRLIRFELGAKKFINLAGLEPGWSILRMRQHGLKDFVILAVHADGKRYRLYQWAGEKLVDLKVEGGPELQGFYATHSKSVVYADAAGQVLELTIGDDGKTQVQPLKPKEGQADSTLDAIRARSRADVQWLADDETSAGARYYLQTDLRWGVEKATGKLIGLQWMRWASPYYQGVKQAADPFGAAWPQRRYTQYVCLQAATRATGSLRRSDPQVYEQFAWREGEIYATAPGAGGSVHIKRFRPAANQVTDLGPVLTSDGKPVERIHQIQTDMAGCLLVLASQGRNIVCVLYKNPGMDDLIRDTNTAFSIIFKDELTAPLRFQTVASMHAGPDGHPQDRNWDPLIADSQGNVHYGAMPHHPTLGSKIWMIDIKTGKVNVLGDIDEIAGNKGPNRVPNMIHMFPVEMDGKLYYSGQDPFYRNRQFVSYNSQTQYVGAPIVSYDLKTGKFEHLGNPLPELTIFGLLPAFTKNLLYVHQNYYNPVWHVFDVKTRQIRKINLPPISKHQHVDEKGLLYFTDAKTGHVMRYDPDTDKVTPFAQLSRDAFQGLEWKGERRQDFGVEWLPSTLGKPVAYGFMAWCEAVLQLDTKAATVKVVARLRPELKEYPVAKEGNSQWGAMEHNGKRFFAVQNLQTTGMMHSILYSLDLASGKAVRHGLMVDEQGRIVREANSMTIAGDGYIYFNGPIYNRPGDAYFSHRFAWSNGLMTDTIIGRITEPKP